jgi:hypothetical protein
MNVNTYMHDVQRIPKKPERLKEQYYSTSLSEFGYKFWIRRLLRIIRSSCEILKDSFSQHFGCAQC